MRRVALEVDGRRVVLGVPDALLAAAAEVAPQHGAAAAEPGVDPSAVVASVPGTLGRWLGADGTRVGAGQEVAVVDAMKMETTVTAHRTGTLSCRAEVAEMLSADQVFGLIG